MKSKERIKKNGEVFTPSWLINEMLDKLPEDAWLPEKKWLEPAAGDGNFVVEILKRRLALGHDRLQILKTTYAVELMEDNTSIMKSRMLEVLGIDVNDSDYHVAVEIMDRNIKCGNFLKTDLKELFPDV